MSADWPVCLIIPPVYEVYRGYIVFAFSLMMFVCVSVNFFSVKDFSETTRLRILKFGTKIRYDKLYCVFKNQPHMAYQSLYLSIFSSPVQSTGRAIVVTLAFPSRHF